MSNTLSLENPAHCLALATHSFGHLPSESVVFIGLTGGTTGPHLRFDQAPLHFQPSHVARMAALISGAKTGEQSLVDAVLVIVVSETPLLSVFDLSREAFGDHGIPVVSEWLVQGEQVSDHSTGTPADASAADLVHHALREHPALMPKAHLWHEIVPTGTANATDRQAVESGRDQVLKEGLSFRAAMVAWDDRIRNPEQGPLDPKTRAMLLEALAHYSDELELIGLVAGGYLPGNPETIMAIEAYVTPDWERIDRFEALLRDLWAYATAWERDLICCNLAWIYWAKGRGSAVAQILDASRQTDPAMRDRLDQITAEPSRWAQSRTQAYDVSQRQ